MATYADQPLGGWRNEACLIPITVPGLDLTGVAVRAQVRLAGDTPGAALLDLETTTDAAATGMRFVGVAADASGVKTSNLMLQVSKAGMQSLPYAGELGDAWVGAYALQIAGVTRLTGAFAALASPIDSDNAPANRPAGYGLGGGGTLVAGVSLMIGDGGVTVSIQGADLFAALLAQAQTAEAGAQLAAQQAQAFMAGLAGVLVVDPLASTYAETWGDSYGCLFQAMLPTGVLVSTARAATDPASIISVDPAGTAYLETWQDGYQCLVQAMKPDGTFANTGAGSSVMQTLLPNDPRITYGGFTRVSAKDDTQALFARPANADGGGVAGDAQQFSVPSAFQAIRTTADAVSVDVTFKGTIEGIVTPVGIAPNIASLYVDGVGVVGTVSDSGTGAGDVTHTVTASGLGTGLKTLRVIPPYYRPAAFGAMRVTLGAAVGALAQEAKLLLVAGTSIECGQAADQTADTYGYLLARAIGYRYMNTGYASRQCHAADGARDGALNADITIYHAFPNDYLVGGGQGKTLAQSATDLDGYLAGFFGAITNAASVVYLCTMIRNGTAGTVSGGVASGENANAVGATPQNYRDTAAARVAAFKSANASLASRVVLVNGLSILATVPGADSTHPSTADHLTMKTNWRAALGL